MTGRTHRVRVAGWAATILGIATVAALASIPISAGATARSQIGSAKVLQSLDAESARQHTWIRLAYRLEQSALAGYHREIDDLTRTEAQAFGGIGAVVCTIGGVRRSSTAFLVGTFDIAVTVAHTFENKGSWARPRSCIYHSTDRWGQIRERIPVAYVKSQWEEDPSAFGEPAKDLAMVRLSRPSRFAQRTLSFSRFAGSEAPVMLIGFRADPDLEPLKHKRNGRLFEGARDRRGPGIPRLMHDMDTRGLASGAPVLDRRDGVVIGIHARVPRATSYLMTPNVGHTRRNAMLVMTEWLERVLRTEIEEFPRPDEADAAAR